MPLFSFSNFRCFFPTLSILRLLLFFFLYFLVIDIRSLLLDFIIVFIINFIGHLNFFRFGRSMILAL